MVAPCECAVAYNMRMNPILTVLLIVLALLILWSAYGYLSVRSIERPSYEVLEKRDGYEIRKYAPYIVAETTVTGSMDRAMNEGFTRIAGFIFGDNTSKASIAMTAPVGERSGTSEKIAMTAPVSEKIAMTAPVSEKIDMTAPVVAGSEANGERVISFVMPSTYTLETLPVPNDTRVKIRAVAGHSVAALSFSWSASAETVAAKKAALTAMLARDTVTATGEPEAAFYNPPWTPPFMLHSEILIPIAQ